MADAALPESTRVLVVGGGPVGLVVSGLLSKRGVPHVVVERRRETRRAPAAHVIRRRPLAILAELGVADEVRASAPALPLDFVTWCATLGGVEIGRLDLRRNPRGGARLEEPWTHCPQSLLEPILRRHAARQAPARILLGACCSAIEPVDGRVSARVRRDDGSEGRIEAEWVVAADGAGSPIRRSLGIPMEGTGPLGRFRMVHFEADLRPWIEGRSGPLFWILNPECPGCLIVHDPTRSHVFMMPMDDREDEQTVSRRLSVALGVPLAPTILSVDTWSPHVQVAARYREGRCLLVGDAAHRFPPTGGLGLSTGIQEAHDLVTRLAAVVAGAPEGLLDGYEAACRPAALANAEESFENLKRLGAIASAIGDVPDLPALEKRLASLTAAERDRLAAAIEAQRSHFLSDGRLPAS